MTLAPFRFELVFTGLCLFVLDEQGATVLLVNAEDPERFRTDPDFQGLDTFLPRPHFASFSYFMRQQLREGVADERDPDRVFASPSGEEVGVCDVAGEDLTLQISSPVPFQPGSLGEAPKLSSLMQVQPSPLASSALPNPAVTTRFGFRQGTLEVLRVALAGADSVKVDFRTINTISTSVEPGHEIADQLVLRVDNLTNPVEIRSSSSSSILLRPDPAASGEASRSVTASLANYHREFHPLQRAVFDFLWFYELIEFTPGPRPSRLDLRLPVYTEGGPGLTGSSGACPPIRL